MSGQVTKTEAISGLRRTAKLALWWSPSISRQIGRDVVQHSPQKSQTTKGLDGGVTRISHAMREFVEFAVLAMAGSLQSSSRLVLCARDFLVLPCHERAGIHRHYAGFGACGNPSKPTSRSRQHVWPKDIRGKA